jgi:hypothetical protein
MNNFKQIGLATHNYHDTNAALPTLSTWIWLNYGSNRETGLFFSLLPYMEEQNLFNSSVTSINNGYYDPSGWTSVCVTVGQFVVKKYICPADSSNTPGHLDANSPFWFGPQFATGGYAGNIMVFDPARIRTLTAAIPDGTSNTVMFGHRLEYCDGTNYWGFAPGQGYYNDWDATPDQTGSYLPVPGFGYPTYLARRGNGMNASINQQGHGLQPIAPNTAPGPDYSDGNFPFQIQPSGGNCDPGVLVSPHSAVMIVCLADGSVRTVPPSISTLTWVDACIPDDGSELGKDW